MTPKIVGIVGAGPAGLMAGTILLENGFEVHFFDHKKTAGRKFLVAGNGGFNLTHSEERQQFIEKYNHPFIQNAFLKFDTIAWRNWLQSIGIETFVGSSGKVFPVKGIKPIDVLTNWLNRIEELGGTFHYSHKLVDFSENEAIFQCGADEIRFEYDYLVLAMGGASWKKTGSTGEWKTILEEKGVECEPFQSSNSGFEMDDWEKMADLEGQILKNTKVQFGSILRKGDVVISSYGLEGAPIYFVNKEFRKNCDKYFSIDLKPTKSVDEIQFVLEKSKNCTEGLKKLNLSKAAIQLLKRRTTKEEFSDVSTLSHIVKKLTFQPQSLRPIDEVISTIGGISMESINESFQLKKFPTIYACGEMLDWDAPTGGYLLQACVSTGFVVGSSLTSLVH